MNKPEGVWIKGKPTLKRWVLVSVGADLWRVFRFVNNKCRDDTCENERITHYLIIPKPPTKAVNRNHCINCDWVGTTDKEECPACGASRDYEFGEIEFEVGLSEQQKEYLRNSATTD